MFDKGLRWYLRTNSLRLLARLKHMMERLQVLTFYILRRSRHPGRFSVRVPYDCISKLL